MKILSEYFNKKISTPVGTIVIVFLALICGGFLIWQCLQSGQHKIPVIYSPSRLEEQIIITTDKTEYEQGEFITAILTNNNKVSIFYSLASWTLYRYENISGDKQKSKHEGQKWQSIPYPWPITDAELISLLELKPNQETEITLYTEEIPPTIQREITGTYKLGFTYAFNQKRNIDWNSISSNEFTIKEKEPEEECYKDPRETLDKFLSYLHSGEYEKAAGLYGDNFPSYYRGVNIQSKADFLRVHCEFVGTCMEHKIIDEERLSTDSYIFGVKFFFYGPEGEWITFALPETFPLPGEKVDEYVSEFGFRVKKIDQNYKVLDVPPQDVP